MLGWGAPEIEVTTSVVWGDYDNDGNLDMLVGNRNESNRVYRNMGGNVFTRVWGSPETEWTFSAA